MAVNLSSLASKTTAALSLSNLILVTPKTILGYQPQNAVVDGLPQISQEPPPTLLFHYEGEQTMTIESDITDHYVEDNTAVQDQIALKPEIVTTRGYIGELNDVVPAALAPLKTVADKLTAIGSYQPSLSATANQIYAEAFFAYQIAQNAVNAAVSSWSSLVGNSQTIIGSDGIEQVASFGLINKQQTMFQQFYGYWNSRVLFDVQTPWAIFKNMAIKSMRAIQDEETRVISTFEVQFKMIRVASSALADSALFQGRSISQSSGLTDLGTSSGQPGTSLATSIARMG